MNNAGIVEFHSWVPRHQLELASFPETHTPPLMVAATSDWNDLVYLLLQNGASDRARRESDGSTYAERRHDKSLTYSERHFFRYQDDGGWHTIIRDLLFDPGKCHAGADRSGELWIQCLRAARTLLSNVGQSGAKLQPLGRKELRRLVFICALSKEDPVSALEAEELWRLTLTQYEQVGLRLCNDRSLVPLAVRLEDPISLEYLLQFGCRTNGQWRYGFVKSPLDSLVYEIKLQPPNRRTAARLQCLQLLEAHAASRALFFTLEFQLIATLLVYSIVLGIVPATY
jgi:hypothetical protein